jgi:hypothetical protein
MTRDEGREIGRRRRLERLAAALRENLKRRKAQRRARGATEESTPPGGPARDASEGPSR